VDIRTPSSKKRRIRNVLTITLITLCLFIPAAEIALRITCEYCTWTETSGEGFVSPWEIRESSWYHTLAPNAVINHQLPEFDYEIRTNSLGFRDIEHPLAKPPGEFRLLAIGDSFTEGWGARFEHTWLNELGRRLNTKHAGIHIRTINAGVAGSDAFFGYRNLVDRLMVYQPDWVLVVINDSDILDVIVRGGMERFQPDGTIIGVDSPEMPFMYESSQFARFILFELFDYTHALLRRPERNRRAQRALEKLKSLLLEYNALLEPQGVKFSLVVQPYTKELVRQEYQRLGPLIEFAEQHQIDVIDTNSYIHKKLIAHENRLEDLYWPIDMHFTELGYRYFSEAIEEGLSADFDKP
jgi:lysophospholipase L1-like esterase